RPGSEDYTPPAYTNQSGKSLTGASVPATLGTIFFTAIFISIGAVFLGIFGIRQYLKSTYDPVSAQVVGYNSYESSNDDGGYTTMYRAIFEYTYNGRTYRKSDSVSSSSPGSDVGEYKTVYVNPANPVEIITNSEQVIFLILGIVFFVVGWLPLILYIRANKRSRR
ncbi:MAG: DUF3592 domain-containing protein, partial [Clostridiales bacterium]|nr:DUF3592 domain-containing protein [Clostridiales bacterium]